MIIIWIDTFRVFRNYSDYYKDLVVGINREVVTTRTYEKYRKKMNFNSFIFGSSRSQAFKCEQWENYLDENDQAFHFDASGEGIYGVANKIYFIDKNDGSIKNVLLVVDRNLLSHTINKTNHLYISPPELSKESKLFFYATFIQAQLNYKFLIAYLDYSIFKTYRDYMAFLISRAKYPSNHNKINCDIWYGSDHHIKIDSMGYYKELIEKDLFYDRNEVKNYKMTKITNLEIEQLELIKQIFDKHGTLYKVIVSPMYDQIPIGSEQLNLLINIFGESNVYNFSGKNQFTNNIGNFYETEHYKPYIANSILSKIYN